MAELGEVLGGILRDVAQARVISDLFSRQVSEEYAADDILSAFPVPRAEIRQATIGLRFAVNAVAVVDFDAEAVRRRLMAERLARLGPRLLAAVEEAAPHAAEALRRAEEKEIDLASAVTAAVEQALVDHPEEMERAITGSPEALARRLQQAVVGVAFDDDEVKRLLVRSTKITDLRRQVQESAAGELAGLIGEVAEAVAAQQRQAVAVDVAVTRGELAELPGQILSEVALVAEIRNYEWNQVGEVNGEPVRRLQPE